MTTHYEVRPFYSLDNPSSEPSGWDVWEITRTSEVIVCPCDTRFEAEAEMSKLDARDARTEPDDDRVSLAYEQDDSDPHGLGGI
jgi:hypothetical protein